MPKPYTQKDSIDAFNEYTMLLKPKEREIAIHKQTRFLKGDFEQVLHEKQKEIIRKVLNSTIREHVVLCARQFGKSFGGVCMALQVCAMNPGTTVYIVGPLIKQTMRIFRKEIRFLKKKYGFHESFFRQMPDQIGPGYEIFNGSDLYIAGFGNNSNPDDMRGDNASLIIIEETRNFNPDDYKRIVVSVFNPMLTHSKNGKIVHMTTPPDDVNHPFVTDTIPLAKKNGTFYSYTIEDNPLLSQKRIQEEIEVHGGRFSEECRRELFCEIVRNQDRVIIGSFNSGEHVIPIEKPVSSRFLVCGDYGGSRDKTAMLILNYDPKTDEVVFCDERIFNAGTPSSEIIYETTTMEKRWGLIDPVRYVDMPEQTRIDLLNDYSFKTRAPDKAQRDVHIRNLDDAFDDGRAKVAAKCKLLSETLESGRWNSRKTDAERSKIYGHADAIFAATYGFRMRKYALDAINKNTIDEDYDLKIKSEKVYIGIGWSDESNQTVVIAINDNLELIHLSRIVSESHYEFLQVLQKLTRRYKNTELIASFDDEKTSPEMAFCSESMLSHNKKHSLNTLNIDKRYAGKLIFSLSEQNLEALSKTNELEVMLSKFPHSVERSSLLEALLQAYRCFDFSKMYDSMRSMIARTNEEDKEAILYGDNKIFTVDEVWQ